MMEDKKLMTLMLREIQFKTKQVDELLKLIDYITGNKDIPPDVSNKIHETVTKMDIEMQLRELLGGIKQ